MLSWFSLSWDKICLAGNLSTYTHIWVAIYLRYLRAYRQNEPQKQSVSIEIDRGPIRDTTRKLSVFGFSLFFYYFLYFYVVAFILNRLTEIASFRKIHTFSYRSKITFWKKVGFCALWDGSGFFVGVRDGK